MVALLHILCHPLRVIFFFYADIQTPTFPTNSLLARITIRFISDLTRADRSGDYMETRIRRPSKPRANASTDI